MKNIFIICALLLLGLMAWVLYPRSVNRYDLNHDGKVNLTDMSIVAAHVNQ